LTGTGGLTLNSGAGITNRAGALFDDQTAVSVNGSAFAV